MANWLDMGVGPFTWYKDLTLKMQYQGEPSAVDMQVAIAFRGDMQIELIQQTNDAPSPYKAFFDRQQLGLHHIAYVTEDMDQALASLAQSKLNTVATIDHIVGRYAYYQNNAMPEVLYELLELDASTEAYWKECIELARHWNGENPITIIDLKGV